MTVWRKTSQTTCSCDKKFQTFQKPNLELLQLSLPKKDDTTFCILSDVFSIISSNMLKRKNVSKAILYLINQIA